MQQFDMDLPQQPTPHVPLVVNTSGDYYKIERLNHYGSTTEDEDDDITNTSWIYEEVTVHSSQEGVDYEYYEELIEDETFERDHEDYRYAIFAGTHRDGNKVVTQMTHAENLPILPPFMDVDSTARNTASKSLVSSFVNHGMDARNLPLGDLAKAKLRKKATNTKLAKPETSPRSAIDFPPECNLSPASAKLVQNFAPDSLSPVSNHLAGGLQLQSTSANVTPDDSSRASLAKTPRDFRFLDDIITRQRRIYLLSGKSKERHVRELAACDKEWKKLLRDQLSPQGVFSQEIHVLQDRIDSSESSVESFKSANEEYRKGNHSARN